MTLTEFLHMGGYAFYVWTSYGLAAVILIANLLVPLLNARRQRRELIGKLRREGLA
jgi:heme exporter protein D